MAHDKHLQAQTSMYKIGTIGHKDNFSATGSITGSQIPKTKLDRMIATSPADDTEVERASYVVINVGHATKYEFKYTPSGVWYDYGIIPVASTGVPVKIDIQPIAWKGGAGATGDVTFVLRKTV